MRLSEGEFLRGCVGRPRREKRLAGGDPERAVAFDVAILPLRPRQDRREIGG